jgi:hypothetical protein
MGLSFGITDSPTLFHQWTREAFGEKSLEVVPSSIEKIKRFVKHKDKDEMADGMRLKISEFKTRRSQLASFGLPN